MHTIDIIDIDGTWMAKHSDPAIKDLFHTDTIATPYLTSTPVGNVVRALQFRNPDKKITHNGVPHFSS